MKNPVTCVHTNVRERFRYISPQTWEASHLRDRRPAASAMYGGGREKKGAAHETKKTKRETKRSKQAAAAAEAEADDGAAPSGNKRDKWLKKDSEDEHGSRRSAAWQPPQGEVDGSLGEQVFMRWDEVLGYADTYAPAPPYCTYGPRVPASCVLHVPEAQGSLPRDLTHGTYAARAPASGVPYVPRTVGCTTGARRA